MNDLSHNWQLQSIFPLLLLLLPSCLPQYYNEPDYTIHPGNNVILSNLEKIRGKDPYLELELAESKGLDSPLDVEEVQFTEWSQWVCLCKEGRQSRSREVATLRGMAFFPESSLQEERPCTHYRCPSCQARDCE